MHYFARLDSPPDIFVSSGHRYKARRALRTIQVEFVSDRKKYFNAWNHLYNELIERHAIRGVARFSEEAFRKQFDMPHMHLWRADLNGKTVAMQLWIEKEDRVYYHLGASAREGYDARASYAIMWEALHYYRQKGKECAVLGGVAGLRENPRDGLARFKRGFSTGKLPSMLCGKIINHRLYDRLTNENGGVNSPYFPKYRAFESMEKP